MLQENILILVLYKMKDMQFQAVYNISNMYVVDYVQFIFSSLTLNYNCSRTYCILVMTRLHLTIIKLGILIKILRKKMLFIFNFRSERSRSCLHLFLLVFNFTGEKKHMAVSQSFLNRLTSKMCFSYLFYSLRMYVQRG